MDLGYGWTGGVRGWGWDEGFRVGLGEGYFRGRVGLGEAYFNCMLPITAVNAITNAPTSPSSSSSPSPSPCPCPAPRPSFNFCYPIS